ncbi:2-hydroxychromene-2-carboxylate isomerase [Pollutimonas harenae]|uniref:2-hydroxychromene-2-carboxylate isomerase n=1 Tax=Pollutimonas harenae TaxID=657015 RepID=A0A853GR95_9BURK|nr:2-hydroxychromene-2-carboxylate isomerase [Pollutimonas harenae]NYT85598.1 2-hydroxychromene-2-carboxylate isomerase [Pollutimonas harenae]TEA70679.1 2-hydroxychromene-2-carboxylate isomerase [Pollutimonas harenae]
MADHIDFYFEFSSPYGYFASTQIEALAAEFQRQVKWHPILLGPMFQATGSAPLVDIPVKGQYSLHDMSRTAELFNIPFKQPDPFPIATVSAARAVLYLQKKNAGQASELAKRLYHAYFAEGRNIGKTEVTLAVAEEVGLSAAELQDGIAQDDIKAQLKQEVNDAMARGVFGSPFMIVDGESFWGFDRFDHIRRWLQQKS